MKRMQKGFTLIELMIVVAIIGILAAVAIPQYQDYTIKAKLSKVQSTLSPLKTAMALFYQENGAFPATGNAWTSFGITTAGPAVPTEVSTIAVAASTGVITITIQNVKADIDGANLIVTPTTVTGQTAMTWSNSCGTSTNAVMKKYFNCP
jgi:type IV pilus assembly protein PilA